MKDELLFKKEQTQHSEGTLQRLQKELEKRQDELEKINTLDSKLSVEFSTLGEKIKQMETDLIMFQDLDGLKSRHEEIKHNLMREKQRTKSRKDSLQLRANTLNSQLDKFKQELQENETMKKMEGYEQKLRVLSSSLFSVNENIQSREREGDYQSILKNIMSVCAQINELLIQSSTA